MPLIPSIEMVVPVALMAEAADVGISIALVPAAVDVGMLIEVMAVIKADEGIADDRWIFILMAPRMGGSYKVLALLISLVCPEYQ